MVVVFPQIDEGDDGIDVWEIVYADLALLYADTMMIMIMMHNNM